MASEKVYVGKAGAQELYKRVEEHIDARIPKVPGAKGNMGKFTEDGSLEDAGVSAAALESAVRDDHTHENKGVLDATTAAYTTEEQEKLGNIEAGAEVNTIVTVKVDGTALTPDEDRAVDIGLSGKVDKVDGKQLSTEDYTTSEKTKLGGIEEGAQLNVIETVQVAGTSLEVTGKAVNIPYAGASVNGVVKLTDDPESVTENSAATPAAIRAALANFGGFMVVPLGQDGKPAVQNPSTKYIYLTKDGQSTKTDPYTEWIYIIPEQGEAHWDIIGEASVNLDNYVQKVDRAVEGNLASLTDSGSMDDSGIAGTDVSDAVSKKHEHSNKEVLDQVEEAYTTAEKTKLAGISNYVESASVSGRTLTLTPKTGEAVAFSDTGDVNVIEGITVNGTALSPDASKSVNIPAASGNADGVVNGTDVTRWNSWDSHNYSIPYEKINIAGTDYEIIPLLNRMWTMTDLGAVTEHSVLNNSGDPKARGYQVGYFSEVTNLLPAGWRIANESDWAALRDSGIYIRDIKSTTGWNSMNGTNKSGLNFYPFGYYSGGSWVNKGEFSCHASYPGANSCFRVGNYTANIEEFRFVNYGSDAYLPIRLVKDIT